MIQAIRMQEKILRKLYKNDDIESISVWKGKENVYCSLNSKNVIVIPKDKFFIDVDKSPEILEDFTGLSILINKQRNAMPAKVNFESSKLIDNGKKVILKIENKTAHAWIDLDLLKVYGDVHDVTMISFKIIDYKNPVFVYENDILVGIVAPTRVQE